MAHVRKDTLVTPSEWAKHLRPEGKKFQAHKERRAAKDEIITVRICEDCPNPNEVKRTGKCFDCLNYDA